MGNLTRQQIIILSVMAVVVLYGAYNLLIAPRKKAVSFDMKNKFTETETFITESTAKIIKDSLKTPYNYIISRAETQWTQDPFYDKKSFWNWIKFNKPEAGSGLKSEEPVFNYSGYIGMGKKKMAIINGIEYETGDNLELEGYILERIYPERVVIVNKKSLSRFEASLQE